MVNETEARNSVRQLLERFELIAMQGFGLAYLMAKRDPVEHARMLEVVEKAIPEVIRPFVDIDGEWKEAYAALDNPNADWPKEVLAMLNHGGIELTGEQAVERSKLMRDFEEKFDALYKKKDE